MRTMFFVRTALGLLLFAGTAGAGGQAGEVLNLASGGAMTYSTQAGNTRLELSTASGTRYQASLARDATVAPQSPPANLKIVGEMKGPKFILIDTYASIPGGMSYCQAGEERFLRVLVVSGKQLQETLRMKLESCRDNLELGSPGIEWQSGTSTLKIDWLQGPSTKGKAEARTIRISETGKPI